MPIKLTITDAELLVRADRIRGLLGQAFQCVVHAGRELNDTKDMLPHGQWLQWLHEEFGFTDRTARRYMRAANFIDARVDEHDTLEWMTGSRRALYRLTQGNVSEEVREAALQEMRDGVFLSGRVVERIIESFSDTVQLEEYLKDVSDRVVHLAMRYDVDPEIVPALTRLEVQLPQVFDEIWDQGYIDDIDGTPIPLEEVNVRDMRDFMGHNRFESQMAAWQAKNQDSYGLIGVRVIAVNGDSVMLSPVLCAEDDQRSILSEPDVIHTAELGTVILVGRGRVE